MQYFFEIPGVFQGVVNSYSSLYSDIGGDPFSSYKTLGKLWHIVRDSAVPSSAEEACDLLNNAHCVYGKMEEQFPLCNRVICSAYIQLTISLYVSMISTCASQSI